MLTQYERVGEERVGDERDECLSVWLDKDHVIAVSDEGPDEGNNRPIMCILLDTGDRFYVYSESKDF